MKIRKTLKNRKITERHVLIVDDDKDFAESLYDLLLMKGYKVTVVYSYEEAVSAVKDSKAEVALVDIRLGTANGVDLMGSLRKAIPEILCVILTAYAGIDNAIKALQNGAYDYLRKPINAEDLFSTLSRCFEKIELEQEKISTQLELKKRNLELEKTVKERNAQIIEREHAEEALRISEENYRALYEDNPTMYFTVSKEGIIQSVNIYGCEQLGYSSSELVGMPVLNVFYEDDKDAVLEQMQKCLNESNTLHSWELRKVHKNGKVISVRETAKTITAKDGNLLILIVCEDITDRKLSEVALFESEKKYRLIADNTADTIAVFDMNLNYTYVSPSVSKLLGYTPDELIELGLEKIMSPNTWQLIQQTFMEEMEFEKSGKAEQNRSRVFITEQYCKNDAKIWVESTTSFIKDKFGKPINILSISRDITERIQAEKIKSAIYRISESAHTASSQDVLFSSIHAIISELMPAKNFYISHYDSTTDTVYFPYYSDEFDSSPPPHNLGLGLTDYVLRTGEPLLASPQVFEQLVQSGQVESVGSASVDWLGVPLKTQRSETIGVMAVQTYTEDIRLTATDQNILEFVSAQVAMAIERKRAEELLLKSEERFRNLYENAPIGLYRTTLDGKILLSNRALVKMLGYTSFDELASRNLEQNSFEPTYERKEFINQVESQGEVHNLEARWIRHDGIVIVAKESAKAVRDTNGKTLYFDGTVEDITEQKIAEEKVKQLSRAVEQSPASIIITDLKGNIEYCNKKVSEVTGYSMEELIGKNPKIFSSGNKQKTDYELLWNTILSGKEWKGEFYNKKKNGEFYWELASISPIMNEKGKTTHFLAVKEDITERIKLFNDLLEAKEKAEESDRLKSEFLMLMSHEIRTPLNIMVGSSEHLRELLSSISNPEILSCFRGIKLGSNRIIRTVNLLLDVSEINASTYKIVKDKINLDLEIFFNLLEEYKVLANQKKLELRYICKIKEPEIFADKYCINQIFSNLIDNAIKYTKAGKVEITMGQKDEGNIFVEIKDTGIGMSKDFLNHIFEPFHQEEQGYSRGFDGNGLGLTLVKKYCDLNNAIIEVESEKNVGSKFSVIFEQTEKRQ